MRRRIAPVLPISIISTALGLMLAAPVYAGTLRGYIEGVEGNTLVIERRKVELLPSTRIERAGDPGVSASRLRCGWAVEVEVEGDAAKAGTLTAKRLNVLTKPGVSITVKGFVEKIEESSLRVDGWPIRWPQGLARDAVKLGMDLDGEGELRDDGMVKLHTWKLEAKAEDRKEREFLKEVSAELGDVRRRLRSASDPTLQEYVTRVGMRVAPDKLKQTEGALAFFVVNNAEPNAFALPDGTVVVHAGLLDVLGNEAQLACVLGHEIAHVTHHHAYRSHQRGHRLGTLASIAAGVTGVVFHDDAIGRVLGSFGSHLALKAAVNGYGRDLEDDADRIGLRYAFDAGYDPYESVEVWRSLLKRIRDQNRVSNWFFGDHATQSARMANLTEELNTHYRLSVQPGVLARNESDYRLALQRHAATVQHATAGVPSGGKDTLRQPREAVTTGCMDGGLGFDRGADVEGVDDRGNTVLMSAVQMCSLPEVRRLVELGANANPKPNAQDFTPLGMALVSGKWDIAEFLVERGARLRAAQIDALFFERPKDHRLLAILVRAEQKEASR